MSGLRLEDQTMSEVSEHEDDVDWRAVFNLLRQGNAAEIPCAEERDYVRRAKQIAKRADKRGITVEVIRGEGVLRVEPRPAAGGNLEAQTSGGEAEL
jgi:hypothetical protein